MEGLILLGWRTRVVGLTDNVVRPLRISDQVRFHSLYVFFALLGGVQAFGVMGLLVWPVA